MSRRIIVIPVRQVRIHLSERVGCALDGFSLRGGATANPKREKEGKFLLEKVAEAEVAPLLRYLVEDCKVEIRPSLLINAAASGYPDIVQYIL